MSVLAGFVVGSLGWVLDLLTPGCLCGTDCQRFSIQAGYGAAWTCGSTSLKMGTRGSTSCLENENQIQKSEIIEDLSYGKKTSIKLGFMTPSF